ncbi:tripartite tricarboxylate transporter substrate binding protein [Alcaligenaceae bacterium C4P045]|nr:tripartite tricarboxylate transporter substrate binding protein [Alcaligenaceae bacterium C4P045]
MFRAIRKVLPIVTLALASAFSASAAEWPAKPITLIVPQGPGSGSDVTARLIAVHLGTALGQPIVVENKVGGGGVIAHQHVMRAEPDGYTLLFTSSAQLIVVPAMNAAAKFGLDDFVAVAPILRAPFAILVANTPTAPKTIDALVDVLRKQPSAFASAGVGTMTQLGSEVFLKRAGVTATHIPYKGSGAALTDLMGGQVLFATDSLTAAMPHIRSGKLRALAVTGDKREAALPDVPTLNESKLPGENIAVIGGLFAPKGLPDPIRERIFNASEQVLRSPDVVAQFATMETGILRLSNDAFMAQLRDEAPRWQALVRQLNLKAE